MRIESKVFAREYVKKLCEDKIVSRFDGERKRFGGIQQKVVLGSVPGSA